MRDGSDDGGNRCLDDQHYRGFVQRRSDSGNGLLSDDGRHADDHRLSDERKRELEGLQQHDGIDNAWSHHAQLEDFLMKTLAFILFSALGFGQMFPGPGGNVTVTASYSGPGDVITSNAIAFWALRAYTSATRGNKLANVCSPADALCGDMLSDATTGDAVIPSLCGGGCTVKILYDLTGLTLCGGPCDLTQSTEANRYTLTVNALNGHPVLTSSSATTFMTSPALGSTVTQPYSTTAVTERTGSFTSFGVVATVTTGSPGIGYNNSANTFFIFAGGTGTASVTDSAFHAIQVLFNGASSSTVVDGSATGGNTSTDSLSSGNSFDLGYTSTALIGATAEVGWWSADKSANFAALKANQSGYYGTP